MFFFVDESGNTGNNLFDSAQPILSYGVLSSKLNPDVMATSAHASMLRTLDVDCLHANQLGVAGLTSIAPVLIQLQRRFQFRFDYYYIHKPTYALVILFDAVFDAGINPAVKWDLYWTPLRFPAIHNLLQICDEETLKAAWRLCIAKDIERRSREIVALLTGLRKRAEESDLDDRIKELFDAAIGYGIEKPQGLDFGVTDQKIISPNAVCFQFVLSSMARRLRAAQRKDALSIKVDRQSEFNAAQAGTHYVQKRISDGLAAMKGEESRIYLAHPLYAGMDDEDKLRKGMPKRKIEFEASERSIGLQLVDIYLWIMRRALSGASLSDELGYLGSLFQKEICVDSISLEGMQARWNEVERQLPEFQDLSDEQRALTRKSIDDHREKVRSLNIQ